MVKFCLCRPHREPQEVMEEVIGLTLINDFSDNAKIYDAYECRYCGRLQFFRKEEEKDPRQKKLKVTA